MYKILLADPLKSSLVMTSEIFKDRIKGCIIHIVYNGKDCFDYVSNTPPDMVVVDFDLPDIDGVMLSRMLRKVYKGPVIMTACPHEIVDEAVHKELFVYNDSCLWVKKPVKMEEFSRVIDQFLLGNRRVNKRFHGEHQVYLVGPSEGRGKRTPKWQGKTIDISMGGVKIHTDNKVQLNKGSEVQLTLYLESFDPKHSRFKAKLSWKNDKNKLSGYSFSKLSEVQRQLLEDFMKTKKPVEDQIQYLKVS